jgi:hypothetical protein
MRVIGHLDCDECRLPNARGFFYAGRIFLDYRGLHGTDDFVPFIVRNPHPARMRRVYDLLSSLLREALTYCASDEQLRLDAGVARQIQDVAHARELAWDFGNARTELRIERTGLYGDPLTFLGSVPIGDGQHARLKTSPHFIFSMRDHGGKKVPLLNLTSSDALEDVRANRSGALYSVDHIAHEFIHTPADLELLLRRAHNRVARAMYLNREALYQSMPLLAPGDERP